MGLGLAFAKELSKRKINTILIGLPNEDLENTCADIAKEFGTESDFYETDLTKKENIISLAKWVNANYSINILINNAGIGGTKRFVDADVDYVNTIIQLNVKATALVTHQLLPNLLKQPEAFILNVSSIAAYSPMGFKTVYPASKAFVRHFTRGLHHELADTNVFVSVVNPGPINTSKEKMDRMNKQSFFAKMALLTPESVAQKCIDQLLKRNSSIVLNKVNGLNLLLMKILPKKWITGFVRKELEEDEQ